MSYPVFPNILKPLTSSKRNPVQKMINSGYENGLGVSRKKNTKMRYEFTLDFQATSFADYMTYEDFFNANKGDTVTLIDPIDGVSRLVKMLEDSISPDFSHSKESPKFSIKLNEI